MNELTHLIMHMQARVHRALMKGLDQDKVSAGQPKVLAFLKSHEGLSQKEIAKACQLEPGSLTVLLNRMEKLGMVERRLKGNNRRTRHIYLTEYGHELADQVVDRYYVVQQMAFADVDPLEMDAFERVCRKVLANLDKEE